MSLHSKLLKELAETLEAAEAYLNVGSRKLPPASEAIGFFDNAATQLNLAKKTLYRLRAINTETKLRQKLKRYVLKE